SRLVRRPFRKNIFDQHSIFGFEIESEGNRRCDRADVYADLPAMHVSVPPERGIGVTRDVAGNGETDSLIATRSGEDECVDSNDTTPHVYQGAAAVPRINRRVCLHKESRIIFAQLTRRRAHDAHTDGVFQSKRAAESHDDLALLHIHRTAERQRFEALGLNLQERKIQEAVHPAELRVEEGRLSTPLSVQLDADRTSVFDDMGVRHDIAVIAENDSRTCAPLSGKEADSIL